MSLVRGASILFIFSKNKLSSSVQSLSNVQLFSTPWTEAHQASQSITNSRSLLKLMFIEFTRSNYLILCRPLLLLPSIFPGIDVFYNKLALRIRWAKYWNFSFSSNLSNEYSGLIFFRMGWFDLLSIQVTDSQESSPIPQYKTINSSVLSFL